MKPVTAIGFAVGCVLVGVFSILATAARFTPMATEFPPSIMTSRPAYPEGLRSVEASALPPAGKTPEPAPVPVAGAPSAKPTGAVKGSPASIGGGPGKAAPRPVSGGTGDGQVRADEGAASKEGGHEVVVPSVRDSEGEDKEDKDQSSPESYPEPDRSGEEGTGN